MTLWPRGLSKDKVDVWLKDLRTPKDLVRSYKAGKIRWKEYAPAYKRSLKGRRTY